MSQSSALPSTQNDTSTSESLTSSFLSTSAIEIVTETVDPTTTPSSIFITSSPPLAGLNPSTSLPPSFISNPGFGTPTFLPNVTLSPALTTISSFSSAASTNSVNHSGQNTTQQQASQSSHTNTAWIIAISILGSLAAICLLGIAIYLILRRRRSHLGHDKGAPSQNVDADTIEKYAGASQYTYSKYQQASAETKGTLPLLTPSFNQSRRSSRSALSGEFGQYQYGDAPTTPFLHEESESTHIPMAHAVPLADAMPYGQPVADAQYEQVDLVATSQSQSSTPKATTQALPPLVIPESKALTRKPTTGKRMSRRSSKHTYRAVDANDMDMSDVDSESMYSQASAYTLRSASSPPPLHDTRLSTAYDFPLAAISGTPQSMGSKHDSASTIVPNRDSRRTSIATLSYIPEAAVRRETEDAPNLTSEDAVLVAKLLKSRSRPALPPTRSESIVSHIERKDSIKPAYRSESGDEVGRQRIRSLRALKKSQPSGLGVTGPADAS